VQFYTSHALSPHCQLTPASHRGCVPAAIASSASPPTSSFETPPFRYESRSWSPAFRACKEAAPPVPPSVGMAMAGGCPGPPPCLFLKLSQQLRRQRKVPRQEGPAATRHQQWGTVLNVTGRLRRRLHRLVDGGEGGNNGAAGIWHVKPTIKRNVWVGLVTF
jgi:hypothetical protein